MIWGGLVPFGDVWVTGAHRATLFETSTDLKINNSTLPAGKYAFFTIPDKSHWTIIFNKKWDQHLADDYNPADDVIRFQISQDTLSSPRERLTYWVREAQPNQGELSMAWELIKIRVPFEVR